MALSGKQYKALQLALIDAFPNTASLEQMLLYELDKNLRAIAGEGTLENLVFTLIKTAASEGWIEDLVQNACKSNPGNPLLKATAQELLRTASTGEQRAGKPFQAPPLPTYYVDRPEYSSELKKQLLTESLDVRALVVTAIHGLGSIGKTTLATALAHDKDVQAYFSDGILWATLGQKPDILSLLSGWVQALDDYNFKPTSIEAASSHLRTLLYDKAVLVVVDDAWNQKDAPAFNVGGARCQVLVTTRDKALARLLGAKIYTLDV